MAIPMVIIHLMKINIHLKMIMATLEIEDHQPEVHLQGSAGGRKAANWEDDIYDTNYNNRTRSRGNSDVDRLGSRLGSTRLSPRKSDQQASSSSGGAPPSRPSVASKPNFGGAQKSNATQAIALYTFKGEQSGDLPFKKVM